MARFECLHCEHEWRGDPGPQKNPCRAQTGSCAWGLCKKDKPHPDCPWGNCPKCGGLYADWLNYDEHTSKICDDSEVPPRGSAARKKRQEIWKQKKGPWRR